jgi:hypothetical protein
MRLGIPEGEEKKGREERLAWHVTYLEKGYRRSACPCYFCHLVKVCIRMYVQMLVVRWVEVYRMQMRRHGVEILVDVEAG